LSEKERVWMQFNVGDYVRDTRHLSTLEHGAYLLLIMRYWEDGGLPDNEALLARYAGLTAEQWAQSRDVLAAFFHDGWHHRRIDDEIAKAAAKIEQRRAARRGDGSVTEARRGSDGKPTDDPRPRVEETITVSSSLRSDEKARAARLPEDWSLPDEWRSDAIEAGLLPERIDFEATRMRDWSRSAAGSAGAKRDWRAAWRNWCRRVASEHPAPRGSPKVPSMADIAAEFSKRTGNEQQYDIEGIGGNGAALPRLSAVR
jgi:uncharacterized protein YdaU (DUF1376 family)